MMAQFMMDLKAEHRTSPSLYLPNSPKLHESYRPDSTDSGVLDLSKRRDSVETRKTPSPYASFSEEGSPPLHSSPINATNPLLVNYHAIHHQQHRELSSKASHTYQSANHLVEHRHSIPAGYHPTQGFPVGHQLIPKHDQLPHRPELPPYLLPSSHIQTPQFQRSPLHPSQETDSLSESGSEGQHLAATQKSPHRKQPSDISINSASANPYPMVVGRDGKLARPFKAYPRDPLSLTAGFMASDSLLDTTSAEKYNMFRKRMLEQIHAANGGQPTVSNPKMRRLNKSFSDASETESVPDRMPEAIDQSQQHQHQQHNQTQQPSAATPLSETTHNEQQQSNGANDSASVGSSLKDSAYYERRKKNNAAAKKSRDRRRIKEDEIAIRAAFLERENIELKFELAAARKQLALYGVTSGSP